MSSYCSKSRKLAFQFIKKNLIIQRLLPVHSTGQNTSPYIIKHKSIPKKLQLFPFDRCFKFQILLFYFSSLLKTVSRPLPFSISHDLHLCCLINCLGSRLKEFWYITNICMTKFFTGIPLFSIVSSSSFYYLYYLEFYENVQEWDNLRHQNYGSLKLFSPESKPSSISKLIFFLLKVSFPIF